MQSLNNPSGFRDLLPVQALQRENMINKVIEIYRSYGFLPLETPDVEFQETLVGQVPPDDFNLFQVVPTKERELGEPKTLALRFDLTVPLARVVTQYKSQLQFPFKRYQLGNVFRGERPQKGRYRQFAQLDADVVGAYNLSTDVDVALMMSSVMRALGIEKYKIRLNTRKLLNALPAYAGFPEEMLKGVLQALDKIEKIGPEAVGELLEKVGLSIDAIEKVLAFGRVNGQPTEVVVTLKGLMNDTPQAAQGLEDLAYIADALSAAGNEAARIVFDMSIIRGLGYYTGTVYETMLEDLPSFGSVCSGGRYDNLTEKMGGQPIPSIGVSVGVDRLYAALEELGIFSTQLNEPNGYLVALQDEAYMQYAFKVAAALRAKGKIAEVYAGRLKGLGPQLGYAEGRGMRYAAIIGANEAEKGEVTVKDLSTKEQTTVALGAL